MISQCFGAFNMLKRLQKIIAESGTASRRKAEELIQNGLVSVNGQTATLGMKADPDTDKILISGKPLIATPSRTVLLLNKPRGVITTRSDEKQRKTVMDLLPDHYQTCYPVGRLDLNSEGLLLLTNDGDLCFKLTHPSHRVRRVYLVWGNRFHSEMLSVLNSTMEIEHIHYHADVSLVNLQGESALLKFSLYEGKNREIRKMCSAAGFQVTRLKRIQYANIKLDDLPPGQYRILEEGEVESLLKSISSK